MRKRIEKKFFFLVHPVEEVQLGQSFMLIQLIFIEVYNHILPDIHLYINLSYKGIFASEL